MRLRVLLIGIPMLAISPTYAAEQATAVSLEKVQAARRTVDAERLALSQLQSQQAQAEERCAQSVASSYCGEFLKPQQRQALRQQQSRVQQAQQALRQAQAVHRAEGRSAANAARLSRRQKGWLSAEGTDSNVGSNEARSKKQQALNAKRQLRESPEYQRELADKTARAQARKARALERIQARQGRLAASNRSASNTDPSR
jgi:serine/threonine protein kinase HipA of HipAB toxin-antitoxin module